MACIIRAGVTQSSATFDTCAFVSDVLHLSFAACLTTFVLFMQRHKLWVMCGAPPYCTGQPETSRRPSVRCLRRRRRGCRQETRRCAVRWRRWICCGTAAAPHPACQRVCCPCKSPATQSQLQCGGTVVRAGCTNFASTVRLSIPSGLAALSLSHTAHRQQGFCFNRKGVVSISLHA